MTYENQKRRKERVLAEAHDHAQAMAQQTIVVFLKTAHLYFGEPLPFELIKKVQNGCNEFSRAMENLKEEFTYEKLYTELERLVQEYKTEEVAKNETRDAVIQVGSLPIL